MDKNAILQVLNDWNPWTKDLPSGIRRPLYLDKLQDLLGTGQVIVITGPRRAGKSFVMRQLANDLIAGGTPRDEILMVNFEDPRLETLTAATLQQIYEVYLAEIHPRAKPVLFLDEVHEVEGWEKWVRTMHELGKATIVLSGSNAKLLSRELATLLTGRHVDVTVFPLSFPELLHFRGIDISSRLDAVEKRIEISRAMRDYLESGGFPLVALSGEKREILLGYYDDVLTKDLIRRFRVRKPEELKSLARFYLSNTATLTTFNSMEKFLKLTADTIDKFSRYLEDAYLLFAVKRFSFKVKEQEKSPRKVYVVDTGLANVVGFRSSPNTGRLAETAVFLELARRRARDPRLGIYYWKDERNKEVDFVITEDTKVTTLLQACWDLASPETRARETKALAKAMEVFGLAEGTILTEEFEAEEKRNGKTIRFVPLAAWLLDFI
jgi:uncharacterized protein